MELAFGQEFQVSLYSVETVFQLFYSVRILGLSCHGCSLFINKSVLSLSQDTFSTNGCICQTLGSAEQGNCIKLGQTHVRLPESGRGAPCGCPPQGITPVTVQIVVRYRKFSTSLATRGRFLGQKKKTIGRGAPCGCPPQGITPVTVQIVVRYRKFSTSLATGGRFLGRKKKTIGRGAPCGRPSSTILASELRCVCPAPLTSHY